MIHQRNDIEQHFQNMIIEQVNKKDDQDLKNR